MDIAKIFNPATSTENPVDFQVKNGGSVVFINESSSNIILKFGNLASMYLPANDRRAIQLHGQMAQPHTRVTWTVESTLPNLNTVNQVVIEIYEPGETLPEIYPAPLFRQTQAVGAITSDQLFNNIGGSLNFILGGGTGGPSVFDFIGNINGTLTLGDTVGANSGKINVIGSDPNSATVIQPDSVAITDSNGNAVSTFGGTKLVVNGGTSGTATIYQDFSGPVKRVLILLNNFRTGASDQTIALSTPFTFRGFMITTGIGTSAQNAGIGAKSGVSVVNTNVYTALAAAGGTVVSQQWQYEDSFGSITGAFDTLAFQGGKTVANTGMVYIVGS